MNTIDARPVDTERNDNLKKAKLEHGFYSVIDGKKAAASKSLPVINPATGKQLAVTLELAGNDSRAVTDTDPEKIALFGSIVLVPVNCKPGRYGLASTLFEILSFRPVRMRTQVLVWSLARKASYTFPMPRKLSDDL